MICDSERIYIDCENFKNSGAKMVNYADVEEQYKKCKDLKKEDVMKVMEWMQHQPHLPKITELQAILFLHSCYYSNEATKQCIDTFYTARTLCPEFFANRNPASVEIQKCCKLCGITPLPKLTPAGQVIFYNNLLDPNPDEFNFNASLKVFDMSASLYLHEKGALAGHIIIMDLKGCTLTHVMKAPIMSVKKLIFFLQEALPFRLQGYHFVNAVPFMDKIMALIKPFMKKELSEMLQIHQSGDQDLFKFIPKDCLPSECGGTLGSLFEFHVQNYKRMLDNADYYAEEEKMVVDESKRPGKPKNAGELFGVEGTFKKLDID